MAQLTVRQAAEQVQVTRQTINRHIRQGKLSATRDHEGMQRIDTSELIRCYGPFPPVPAASTGTSSTKFQPSGEQATVAHQVEVERLKVRLEAAEAALAVAQERIAEGRADRDRLMEILDRQSRLLAAPAAASSSKRKGKR